MSLTDEHVLAAYVDGSDLETVAPTLRAAFDRFAVSGTWTSGQVLIVDQQQPPDAEELDFLPQWDLGLNLGLDHLTRSTDWFPAIESLVALLQNLSGETGREFALFLCFRSAPWRQEHLAFIGSGPFDPSWLCEAIQRLTSRSS
ncbi:MAG TPA: hypothetical protein VHE81_14435 [Lacipirellulaceae bacterium]|nr:hypothetical protein [Lacipirellulaceae bacterium]